MSVVSPHTPDAHGAKFLIGITVLAFCLRFLLIPNDALINGDGVYYATLGMKFAQGDLIGAVSAYWAPLYPILIGAASIVFQDPELSGRMISVIAGSALVLPSFFLFRRFFGIRHAYIGSVLVVFHPLLMKSSGWVMTESLYTLIFTTLVFALWTALNSDDKTLYLAIGLLLGTAYLTKPEAIGFFGLTVVLIAIKSIIDRRVPARSSLVAAMVVLGGFAVMFVPYVVVLKAKTGHWTISDKIMTNAPITDEKAGLEKSLLKLMDNRQITFQDKLWGDRYEFDSFNTQASENVVEPTAPEKRDLSVDISIFTEGFVYLHLYKQIRNYLPAILPPVLALFTALGLIGALANSEFRIRAGFLLLLIASTIGGYAVTVIEFRYLFALIPIFLIFTANGVVMTSNLVKGLLARMEFTALSSRSSAICMTVTLVALLAFIPIFAREFKPLRITDAAFEERTAGLWIRENSVKESPIIISSSATVAFYARGKHLFLPDEDVKTIIDHAIRRDADFIVISKRRQKTNAARLFDEFENGQYGIELALKDDEYPGFEIYVFRLIK